ncbi:MAG: Gfo/Idh/MocA family oxidoreductase [Proteobacteria bacterium]|nr:Gfo/Idh/MocA family oxidoreductase [Pseudomonadota bacterium]MBU1739034.1 Gfo/Idh/MocA family oxidoreductase [Pseudomonadota bacterium]
MKKVRVGVIGVGYLGKFHAQKYAAMDHVELCGVSDVDPKMAESVALANNTRPFTDYRSLLKEVDAVSVVVPTSLHHRIGKECLEAGVDVMLEKPMTTTVAEADELISIASERGRILQVGHLERFNPAVLAMEEYLTKPLFIESHRIHMFKNRALDVDVVLDLMIHDIDIIMNIVDSPIQTIHTVGLPVVTQTTDIANARLIFENGCTANVTVSRISRDNIRRLRVFQPHSFISVDYGKKELTVIKQLPELDSEGMPRREVFNSCYVEKDALEMELRDFVDNVSSRTKPRVSGIEGKMALKIATEIISQINAHLASHKDHFGL